METNTAILCIIAIIVIVIVLTTIGYLASRQNTTTSTIIPKEISIKYLPESEIGYKILMGENIDLDSIPKNDEFFLQTWLVRDKIPKWDEWFQAAHARRRRRRGVMTTPLDQSYAKLGEKLFNMANAIPSTTPTVIELVPTILDTSDTPVKIFHDGSSTLPRIDIAKLIPGLASLTLIDPTDKLAATQLLLAQENALQPINQMVDTRSSIGGLATPSEVSSFLANRFYITDLMGGYKVARYSLTQPDPIDFFGPADEADINMEYLFTIPFETGGLEIYSYSYSDDEGDNRVVISNLWQTGTIKCFFQSQRPILVATPDMVNSTLAIRGTSALVQTDGAITINPVESEADRMFNLFDTTMGIDGSIMQLAANGKYDPDSNILTSVYAGVGFIANLTSRKFAAQFNLADEPTPTLDFTDSTVDVTIESLDGGGSLDETGKIISLVDGYTTVTGTLTPECCDNMISIIVDAPAPPPTSVLNK